MNDIDFRADIEKIKEDIKSLVNRLKNIKDKSGSNILEEITELSSVISKLKNNNDNKNSLLTWCSNCGNILNHPIKNIAYAFTIYTIFSILFKRKD